MRMEQVFYFTCFNFSFVINTVKILEVTDQMADSRLLKETPQQGQNCKKKTAIKEAKVYRD